LAARLCLDPLGELKHPQDLLAIKGEGKGGERKKAVKGGRSKRKGREGKAKGKV